MKKFITLIVLVLVITISFNSCKKETERESKFTLNNIDHYTDHGFKALLGSSETQSGYYVFLCSSEADFDINDGLTGYGDIIFFSFVSNDPAELISDDYSQSGMTLNAQIILGYDEDLDEAMMYSLDSYGTSTATLTVSGDIFEIEYSLELSTGSTATGYYKGTLEEMTTTKSSLPGDLAKTSIPGIR